MFDSRPIDELAADYVRQIKRTQRPNMDLYHAMVAKIGVPATAEVIDRMVMAYDLLIGGEDAVARL